MSARITAPRCCSFCHVPGHIISRCNSPQLKELEIRCIERIVEMPINHRMPFRLKESLCIEYDRNPNLLKAFSCKYCGTTARRSGAEHIDNIVHYFNPVIEYKKVMYEVYLHLENPNENYDMFDQIYRVQNARNMVNYFIDNSAQVGNIGNDNYYAEMVHKTFLRELLMRNDEDADEYRRREIVRLQTNHPEATFQRFQRTMNTMNNRMNPTGGGGSPYVLLNVIVSGNHRIERYEYQGRVITYEELLQMNDPVIIETIEFRNEFGVQVGHNTRVLPRTQQQTQQTHYSRQITEKMVAVLKEMSNDKEEEEYATTECPICFEECMKLSMVNYNCGHQFCGQCVKQSIEKSISHENHRCALCRTEVEKMECFNQETLQMMNEVIH